VPFGSAQQKQTQKKKQKKAKNFHKISSSKSPKSLMIIMTTKMTMMDGCIMGFVKFVKNTLLPHQSSPS
jgi:hypothetical protein